MGILRFPNPGSDFGKLVTTFQTLYAPAHTQAAFDLDFAVRCLIEQNQVSSSGAVGKEALRRSTRADRSRDPLYNQLKMYSELFRMLGWIHPGAKKLEFHTTTLGRYVGEKRISDNKVKALIRECLMSITFPNPNTENIGVVSLRPFFQLLRMMRELDGLMSRDEMIVGLYTLINDSADEFAKRVQLIRSLRGRFRDLQRTLVRTAGDLQVNTLLNYTRFPLGALKSTLIGWANDEPDKAIYGRSVVFYRLTEQGRKDLGDFERGVDIRNEQLAKYEQQERAHFICLSYYAMLIRAGYQDSELVDLTKRHEKGAQRILTDLTVPSPSRIFFSPYQQADHADLAVAEGL